MIYPGGAPCILQWILWRRDLIENEENEIDSTEDAIEREHCYICDEKLRTGWKSSKHIDGRHLILTIWTRWTSYYFFLVFLNVIYFNVFVILTWETFVVWSWLFIQWKLVTNKDVISEIKASFPHLELGRSATALEFLEFSTSAPCISSRSSR